MAVSERSSGSGSIVMMVLSAAIFGFAGFGMGLTDTATDGNTVFFFALLLWTLRIGAIAFLACAAATFASARAGELLYAAISLITAAALAAVAIMDLMDATYAAAIPPVLLLLVAAWNGYSSIQELLVRRPEPGAGAS